MVYMAIRIFIAGLFSMSATLTLASSSASYDLCDVDSISDGNFTITLNVSEDSMESASDCSRVVIFQSKRVKLTVEQIAIADGSAFEIHDGPYAGQQIGPKTDATLPSSYVSTGNAMFLSFKRGQSGKSTSIFRGKITAEPYQTTCHCRGVKNGGLECAETDRERQCKIQCQPSFIDLFTANELKCDLVKGKWDTDIHNAPLSCQKATSPLKVQIVVRFNYANGTCQDVDTKKIEDTFRQHIAGNNNVTSKGVCFAPDGQENCLVKPLEVNCTFESSPNVSVTIKDNIATPSNLGEGALKFQDLFSAFKDSVNLQEIADSVALTVTKGNATFTIDKESFVVGEPSRLCDDTFFSIKSPGNASFYVCSTCPSHHFYNSTSETCQQCPHGSLAPEGAVECTQMNNDTTKMVPVQTSCSNKCMKGKQVDSKSWMCEWCPYDTYQNYSMLLNPKCISCPDQKKTPFPGVQNISYCYNPCDVGSFLNISSGQCQKCSRGTYMDIKDHVFTKCKTCDMGKTTWNEGSKLPDDCYTKCQPGEFIDVSSKSCSPCPIKKYQDELNKDSCKNCPSKTTTLSLGSNSMSDCVAVCGLGQYRNIDRNACEHCPKDTYQDQTKHSSTECQTCGTNKFTRLPGQTNISSCISKCSKGWFSDKSVCKKCSKGFYQDQQGQAQCKQCPDGKSTVNEGQVDESACIATCKQGEFYDATGKTCTACPYGRYQEAIDHLETECTWCPSKKTDVEKGALNPSYCSESACRDLPCQNGASCSENEEGAICHCPEGIIGTFCEKIEHKDTLHNVKMSLRFTSLSWSDELEDKTTLKFNETKNQIEGAIRFEFRYDPSFEDVQVTDLTNGSVVAEFDLYFNDEADYVPAKAVQTAASLGEVQNISVSIDSLKILYRDCKQPLGMENSKIKDGQITASTHFRKYEPFEARLNAKGGRGWQAKYLTNQEYLQIDFKDQFNVSAVATQGGPPEFFVKKYKLSFSDDGKTWQEYTEDNTSKIFQGNDDSDSVVKNNLQSVVSTRYIRFIPQAWNASICMRVEVYGCLSDPYIHADQKPQPTDSPASPPDVGAVKEHRGGRWGVYLGIAFGLLLVVGVVVSIICWRKKSQQKKKEARQVDESLMPMKHHNDGQYRVIQKNSLDPVDDEENAV